MPPLDHPQPILPATLQPNAHPAQPSPSQDGLALEVMSGRELGYWGQRFGVDQPYYFTFLGWGEVSPLY